jgi:hypothetical protein
VGRTCGREASSHDRHEKDAKERSNPRPYDLAHRLSRRADARGFHPFEVVLHILMPNAKIMRDPPGTSHGLTDYTSSSMFVRITTVPAMKSCRALRFSLVSIVITSAINQAEGI